MNTILNPSGLKWIGFGLKLLVYFALWMAIYFLCAMLAIAVLLWLIDLSHEAINAVLYFPY